MRTHGCVSLYTMQSEHVCSCGKPWQTAHVAVFGCTGSAFLSGSYNLTDPYSHSYSHCWLLVTSPCASFAIFGWVAICLFMYLSAGRGYFLTSHSAGGEIILLMSQVHATVDRSWMYLSHICGTGLTKSSKLWWWSCFRRAGHYVAVKSWQGHPTISQIADGRRICWSWATVTPQPLHPVPRAKNSPSDECWTCAWLTIMIDFEVNLTVDSSYENMHASVTGS